MLVYSRIKVKLGQLYELLRSPFQGYVSTGKDCCIWMEKATPGLLSFFLMKVIIQKKEGRHPGEKGAQTVGEIDKKYDLKDQSLHLQQIWFN